MYSLLPLLGMSVSQGLKRYKQESVYLEFGGCIDMYSNPCDWWCQNGAQVQLLNKFFIANCAFPVTSTSSERAFSTDGLILIPQRRRLDLDRTENLVVCRDYWMSRSADEALSFVTCVLNLRLLQHVTRFHVLNIRHQKKQVSSLSIFVKTMYKNNKFKYMLA